jgi:ketopantoate reductase
VQFCKRALGLYALNISNRSAPLGDRRGSLRCFSDQGAGVIAQTAGPGKIVFGELGGGTSPRTERLHDMLQRAGIAVELHHTVQVVLWQKFLFICAFSGVTAVSRLPIGTILADPVTHDLFRGASEEVEAVARARIAVISQRKWSPL